MQKKCMEYKSPLYGRHTAQLKIELLTYKETAVFNPELKTIKKNYYEVLLNSFLYSEGVFPICFLKILVK